VSLVKAIKPTRANSEVIIVRKRLIPPPAGTGATGDGASEPIGVADCLESGEASLSPVMPMSWERNRTASDAESEVNAGSELALSHPARSAAKVPVCPRTIAGQT
jgi:hypothetical protein